MVVYNRSSMLNNNSNNSNNNNNSNNKSSSSAHNLPATATTVTNTNNTTTTTTKTKQRWVTRTMMIFQFVGIITMVVFVIVVLLFRWRTFMMFHLASKNKNELLLPPSIVVPTTTITNTTTTTTTTTTTAKNDTNQSIGIATSSTRIVVKSHVQSSSSSSSSPLPVQLPPPRYPLEFVHIPKTGGTAIETAAAKGDNMAWGACHYCMKSKGTPCPPQHRFFLYRGEYLTSLPQTSSSSRSSSSSSSNTKDKQGTRTTKTINTATTTHTTIHPWPAFWHIPPSYMRQTDMLQQALPNFFTNNKDTIPYPENIPLFAVVRNPYHRMLSEWYYDAQETRKMGEEYSHNATEMNQYILHQLQQFQQVSTTTTTKKNTGKYTQRPRPEYLDEMTLEHPYWMMEGHYIPQYDYIYDTIANRRNSDTNNNEAVQQQHAQQQQHLNRRQIVQHVLKFENLTMEYTELMEQYGLQNRLPTQRINTIPFPPVLTISNFSRHVLQLMNDIYHNDFVMFGYDKIKI